MCTMYSSVTLDEMYGSGGENLSTVCDVYVQLQGLAVTSIYAKIYVNIGKRTTYDLSDYSIPRLQ